MTRLKDKLITIYETHEENIHGVIKRTWTIKADNLFAFYQFEKADSLIIGSNNSIKTITEHNKAIFVINWRNDLTISDKVKYNGKYYDILSIDDFRGYKQDIKLNCQVSDNQKRFNN